MEYFDYLEDKEYVRYIEKELGCDGIDKDVASCRGPLMDIGPEYVAFRCRTILERSINELMEKHKSNYASLDLTLERRVKDAFKHYDFLNKYGLKGCCKTLRKNGNDAAHEKGVINRSRAVESLKCLDTYLRSFLASKITGFEYRDDGSKPVEGMLKSDLQMAINDLAAKQDALKELSLNQEAAASAVNVTEGLVDILVNFVEQKLIAAQQGNDDNTGDQERGLFGNGFDLISDGVNLINDLLRELNDGIGEILQEQDFIEMLLDQESASSTEEQQQLMAFPEGTDHANVLQIQGGPGTGKTLCMLAKLIQETGGQKTALFACFNRPLRSYVRDLVKKLDVADRITIINYDTFVEELVKNDGKNPELGKYNVNNRYDTGFNIYYGKEDKDGQYRHIKEARGAVVLDGSWDGLDEGFYDYLLYSDRDQDLSWLENEILWIEANLGRVPEEEAHKEYLSVPRMGKGDEEELPTQAKELIYAVRLRLNESLAEDKLFTEPQATNKLLDSDDLPHYDLIAIDEAQDLRSNAVEFLLRTRRDNDSIIMISADEKQRIFDRDFSWDKVRSNGNDLRTHTVTLTKNERNSSSIRHFCEMIQGIPCKKSIAEEVIVSGNHFWYRRSANRGTASQQSWYRS